MSESEPLNLELWFDMPDKEWVLLLGRFMLNMGVIEFTTRLFIFAVLRTDAAPIFSDDLSARIGFVRKHFPREDRARHQWAMNALDVAKRLAGFRNIVAHSLLAITGHADGAVYIRGLMNVTPKDRVKAAELVKLDELRGRVAESTAAARDLVAMQADFPGATFTIEVT